jgi:hypothetical protein
VDQEVLGDQQLVVELVELVVAAVEAAGARELEEKQTHRMPVQVVGVVQGLPVELVVVAELTLGIVRAPREARELQTLVVIVVMVGDTGRVEDWVQADRLDIILAVPSSRVQLPETVVVRVVRVQLELVAQQEITGPRDQPGRQAQRDRRVQRVRRGQRGPLARREARYLVMRM